jgi:hypothetical protein
MRQPTHIILDFESDKRLKVNWSTRFIEENYQYSKVFPQVNLFNKFYVKQNFYVKNVRTKKYKYKFFSENNKMTFVHSDYINLLSKPLSPTQYMSNEVIPTTLIKDTKVLKLFLTKNLTPDTLFKEAGYLDSSFKIKSTHPSANEKLKDLRKKKIIEEYVRYYTFIYRRLYLIKSSLNTKSQTTQPNIDILYRLVTLNFIKKERLYTKLKYSRSPAYDIVSGGAAALLAGFLGFLISEKYGFELADSGDFYYLFMYGVFFCFLFKPIVTSIKSSDTIYDVFSLRFFLNYYFFLINFFLRKR